MQVLDTIRAYFVDTGFGHMHWSNLAMIGVGLLFIFLAVRKKFEPLLLAPIGFGILVGNIPYDASRLSLGVYDGPVSQHDIAYFAAEPRRVTLRDGTEMDADALASIDSYDELMHVLERSRVAVLGEPGEPLPRIDDPLEAMRLLHAGRAIMVNMHSFLPSRHVTDSGAHLHGFGGGRHIVTMETTREGEGAFLRYAQLWSMEKQDPYNASVFWWLFAGVGLAGIYPPLIFLGIGALTDFGPMLSNPKTLLLGAAAQFGIFSSLLGAVALGFTLPEAASIGIIGGADGPTAIFTCSKLAPDLLGAVALAAYSYMALVPIIQPPIIKLLTSEDERRIRMTEKAPVSRTVRVIFPIAGFLLTALLAPGGLPLLGMLFFGNLLRESLVTDRLAKTASTSFIDIVTILLGVTVGAKTSAANFLTLQTIYIFVLGVAAFAVATACGVLVAKLMNLLVRDKVNPMIGAAGVSAVPMSARVVHGMGQKADPSNFLLMHAMGPNVAGVIGSAVAAGVLLSRLS